MKLFLVLLFSSLAHAEIEWIPQSRHHLFQNFGNLSEPAISFLYESAANTSGGAGDSLPLVQFGSSGQLTFLFVTQSFQQIGGDSKFALQSSNGIGGVVFELPILDTLRLQIGYAHSGGHYADGSPYSGLFNLSALYDRVILRGFYDFHKIVRGTLALEPITRSTPELQWLVGEQSIEIFPTDLGKFHPYFAIGVKQIGITGSPMNFSWNTQIGVSSASPFNQSHSIQARLALGYYTGADLSIKSFVYTQSSPSFLYLGIFFNL